MNDASPSADEPNVVLITGAGRRVGNRVTRALAAGGYRLALHANRSLAEARATADELRATGTEAIAVQADLADEAATRAMVASVGEHFGRLDALVNNASVWSAKRLEEVAAADVRRHLEVNTVATFVCGQAAGLLMAEQPTGGSIVNIGDWATARPYVDYAHYFASKGSVESLTRAMAVELAERNPRVRVNAILPGPVLFPEELSESERGELIESTLVKRPGTPEDVAHAVVFLLENTFVTGVCLPVDGGRSIYTP